MIFPLGHELSPRLLDRALDHKPERLIVEKTLPEKIFHHDPDRQDDFKIVWGMQRVAMVFCVAGLEFMEIDPT